MTELGYSQKEDFATIRWILPNAKFDNDCYEFLIDELVKRDMFVKDFVEEFADVYSDPWMYLQAKQRLRKLVTKRTNAEIRQAFKATTNNPEVVALF